MPTEERAALDNLSSELEEIARQIRRGDYTASDAAVLLTRDVKTGIVTVCRWGEREDTSALIHEVADFDL